MNDSMMDSLNTIDGPETAKSAASSDSGVGARAIAFLFLHEQPHQIPHLAPIMEALVKRNAYDKVQAFVMGRDKASLLKSLIAPEAMVKVDLTVIEAPFLAKALEMLIGKAAPIQRIGALYSLKSQLEKFDVIASPETTCLLLRTHFSVKNAKIVWTQHGCGDRAAGFKKSIVLFDHVFVPGVNQRDRMLKERVITEGNYTVVGYPKFDLVDHSAKREVKIFANDKPAFVYNPHFDPSLSSWYKQGEKVLELFASRPDFNLIFAPHIMLFTRKLHMTGDFSAIAWRKSIPQKFYNCPNIHIDTGSINSIDMTYTHAADAYIGDVSSQLHEFLINPRLCVFLNSHGVDWRDDPNYANWRLGEVINDPQELRGILDNFHTLKDRRKAEQETAFRNTFDEPVLGGAERAAQALSNIR
ncbi:hypothetical protein [Hyphococcus sp.]|uniref:hypothetical protein n=1 Tax=Hyphococcus sp. TaxID=2038636 RepID=UPI003751F64B